MLQLESIAIEKLIPYARNSRTHSDEQIAQIAASIKEFGFTNPVLIDKDDGIIAGHGRVSAARKLSLTTIPCLRLKNLTETQKKAYIIADNKLALNAGWDNEMLTIEIEELLADGFAMDILGFDPAEIQNISDQPDFEPNSSTKEIDPNDYVMGHQCPKCGFEFDKKT
jgi:ParB family transcriptional regulator, chromosome partitioning protein